jgi:hypothetical protein
MLGSAEHKKPSYSAELLESRRLADRDRTVKAANSEKRQVGGKRVGGKNRRDWVWGWRSCGLDHLPERVAEHRSCTGVEGREAVEFLALVGELA